MLQLRDGVCLEIVGKPKGYKYMCLCIYIHTHIRYGYKCRCICMYSITDWKKGKVQQRFSHILLAREQNKALQHDGQNDSISLEFGMASTAVIVFDGRITECYFWECCSSVVTVEFRCFIFNCTERFQDQHEELDSTDGLIFSSDV